MIQQNTIKTTVYIHLETSNKSFLDMHYYLRGTGRKNNAFMLQLFDHDLAGVNPRDPRLNQYMKAKVLKECMCNYWYFLREVVRIPSQGGEVGAGMQYGLHRGNMAMNFGFCLNWNMFAEFPRQNGKTIAAVIRYLWCYNFGTSNSEIMFINKKFDDSKLNLQRMKEIRDVLPDYLQLKGNIAADGSKVKAQDRAESIENPINKNRVRTLASAKNKVAANSLGRG